MRCAPLCFTITQHSRLKRVPPSYREKAGSAVSEAPSLASYLSKEPPKGPVHRLQRPIERERWHAHMQLSCLLCVCRSVCRCVRPLTLMQYCAQFFPPFHSRSVSISVHPPPPTLHTYTLAQLQIAEGRIEAALAGFTA